MTYAATAVSSSIKDSTMRESITANKFTKMLKSKEGFLSYPKADNISKATLICFSDVSFAKLKCDGSKDGLPVFADGNDRRYILLAWQSKKLKLVIKST